MTSNRLANKLRLQRLSFTAAKSYAHVNSLRLSVVRFSQFKPCVETTVRQSTLQHSWLLTVDTMEY